ncbi:MAG: hypothetical protein H0W56_12700, partial [Acidothermales bacterium]|nr:hypothetical protein [Acidothermales bacterium]
MGTADHGSTGLDPAVTFAQLARELAAESDVEHTLDRVVQLAVENGPCNQASISFRYPDGRLETVAASDAVIEKADGLQYALREG